MKRQIALLALVFALAEEVIVFLKYADEGIRGEITKKTRLRIYLKLSSTGRQKTILLKKIDYIQKVSDIIVRDGLVTYRNLWKASSDSGDTILNWGLTGSHSCDTLLTWPTWPELHGAWPRECHTTSPNAETLGSRPSLPRADRSSVGERIVCGPVGIGAGPHPPSPQTRPKRGG